MKPWAVIKQWQLDKPEAKRVESVYETERLAKTRVVALVFKNFEAVEIGALKIWVEYRG